MFFDVHYVRGSVQFGRLSARGNAARGLKQFSPSSCSFIAVLSGLVVPTYEFVYLGKSRIAGEVTSSPLPSREDPRVFGHFESLRSWRDKVFYLAATMLCQICCGPLVGGPWIDVSVGLLKRKAGENKVLAFRLCTAGTGTLQRP